MKLIITWGLFLLPFFSICQVTIKYHYDGVGNRTNKEILVTKMDEINFQGDTIKYIKSDTLPENASLLKTIVFPNPTYNLIEISTTELSLPINYTLYDFTGKIFIENKSLENNFSIDLGELSSGTYILSVIDTNKKIRFKIIKN